MLHHNHIFQNSVPLELVVDEELPIGSQIGEVQAIDEDEGDNAIIDYAIIGNFIKRLSSNLVTIFK